MNFFSKKRPLISVIVVFYNMQREAARTLFSLSPSYQKPAADNYEVIVVENGSSERLEGKEVRRLGANFRYFYFEAKTPSPAEAINFGVSKARGEMVGICIDGARILTPGILDYVIRANQAYRNPFVATLGWHLGPDVQSKSTLDGYDKATEDELLKSINWRKNPYKMFEVSTLGGSYKRGWFASVSYTHLRAHETS